MFLCSFSLTHFSIRALSWYKKAADLGDKRAIQRLRSTTPNKPGAAPALLSPGSGGSGSLGPSSKSSNTVVAGTTSALRGADELNRDDEDGSPVGGTAGGKAKDKDCVVM